MSAEDLLRDGDVQGALDALQGQVRAKPQDAKLRIFLFQLLCVLGDWKRAVTQLKVSAELHGSATTMAQTYREAITCELFRDKVFAGEKEPLVFGEPQDWVARMIEAQKYTARGEHNAAADLRGQAFEAAPAEAGRINGEPFEWVADADMRLGPLLEMIVNGRYFWVPFTAISRMKIEPPSDLRDAVWTPAEVKWKTGGDMWALIPTRYPGSQKAGDAVKLGRVTEWEDIGADTWAGLGQRLLATDQSDTGIMDLRVFEVGESIPDEEEADEAGDTAGQAEAGGGNG